jgi:uncharacterized membrane protein
MRGSSLFRFNGQNGNIYHALAASKFRNYGIKDQFVASVAEAIISGNNNLQPMVFSIH